MDNLNIWVALATGAAVALAIFAIAGTFKKIATDKASAELRKRVERFSGPKAKPINRSAKNLANQILSRVYRLGSKTLTAKMRASLARRLGTAGEFDGKAVNRIASMKIGLGVLGLLVGVDLATSWGSSWVLLIPIAGMIGYFAPDLWIYDRGVNRAQQIGFELPEAIDLMYLSVSSGVSLNSAMQKVTENQSGPAAGELTRVLEEMRLGVSRADAFRSLVQRIRQPDMVRFAEAMIKIDQLGISLTTVLEEQAREMRQRRRALAREKAQQVSVRILMPLVLCFLPGLFIVVLGPAVASIFNLFAK
jgi:tight adherence protein C